MDTTMNKEQIYDEQIHPLMKQIVEICQDNGISMLCDFEIPNEDDPWCCCTTRLTDQDDILSNRYHRAGNILLGGREGGPLMITTTGQDGAKTMTAILG